MAKPTREDYEKMSQTELVNILVARDADPEDISFVDSKISLKKEQITEIEERISKINEIGLLAKEERDALKDFHAVKLEIAKEELVALEKIKTKSDPTTIVDEPK